MVKKLLILSTFLLINLIPLNTFAEVVDGTATIGSGVINNGSSYGFTPNVNLSSSSSNEYYYSSAQDNPFILGARYVAPVSLGSAGANNFSGVVEVPVAITYNPSNGVSTYNKPTKNAFHVGLGGFYDWGTLDFTVTNFSSSCGEYSPINFSFPYRICVYRVSFTAKSSSMIYGNTNLSFSVYDWSNANNLVFQTLGHSWGSGNFNGGWAFPKNSTDIDGGENIAPYYVLSYGNNVSETLLQQQIEQSNTIISQNQQIINNQNNNTNSIINNQDSNTQDIINNQDSNTQDIIDNQNQNTQDQIESQKVCKTSIIDKSFGIYNGYLMSNGSLRSNSENTTTDYIEINNDVKLSGIQGASTDRLCFYNENKTYINCLDRVPNGEIQIPSGSKYFRLSISINTNLPKLELTICQNGNQALDDSVNNLNDTLNSTDTPNTNQDINDMNDMVASNTPITDLLTLPLTLINAYYVGITSTCSPYNFGSLLGTDIIFPCINLEQRLGSNLWLIIDSLCCIFLIYSIAMLFVHAFDNLTSLKDDFDDMYVPKHAGKHVGSGING